MLDGRVKTLHPAVHGGILARRDRPDDLEAIARARHRPDRPRGRQPVPVRDARRPKPATPFDALVEEIDIGGPSLVRAAAKNFRDVLVVVSPADYAAVLERAGPAGRAVAGVPLRARAHGLRAHRRLRRGDRGRTGRGRRRGRRTFRADRRMQPGCRRSVFLAPAQGARPALRREPAPAGGVVPRRPTAPVASSVLQGKELSFTNLLDLDSAARIAARVRRAGGRRHQAHEPVRRGDRRDARRRPTCGRARPTRWRRSAASSA